MAEQAVKRLWGYSGQSPAWCYPVVYSGLARLDDELHYVRPLLRRIDVERNCSFRQPAHRADWPVSGRRNFHIRWHAPDVPGSARHVAAARQRAQVHGRRLSWNRAHLSVGGSYSSRSRSSRLPARFGRATRGRWQASLHQHRRFTGARSGLAWLSHPRASAALRHCLGALLVASMNNVPSGQAPNPSIERTSSSKLRLLPAAAHVER